VTYKNRIFTNISVFQQMQARTSWQVISFLALRVLRMLWRYRFATNHFHRQMYDITLFIRLACINLNRTTVNQPSK
jgi:hypothetical protein